MPFHFKCFGGYCTILMLPLSSKYVNFYSDVAEENLFYEERNVFKVSFLSGDAEIIFFV